VKRLHDLIPPTLGPKTINVSPDRTHAWGVRFQGGAADAENLDMRPIPEAPTFEEGINWATDKDWFTSCFNLKAFMNGENFEWVKGVDVRVGLSVQNTIILGAQHSFTSGVARTGTWGFENQIFLGVSAHFINPDQEETVTGWKKVQILGRYIIMGKGKNVRHIGTHKVDYDAFEQKFKAPVEKEYRTVVEDLISSSIKKEAKKWKSKYNNLNYACNKVKRSIDCASKKFDTRMEEIDKRTEKISTLTEKYGSLQEESSGKFQQISSAALEFKNSATSNWKYKKLKVVASSMTKFAAALSKVGG
jgi:hypothetical protein